MKPKLIKVFQNELLLNSPLIALQKTEALENQKVTSVDFLKVYKTPGGYLILEGLNSLQDQESADKFTEALDFSYLSKFEITEYLFQKHLGLIKHSFLLQACFLDFLLDFSGNEELSKNFSERLNLSSLKDLKEKINFIYSLPGQVKSYFLQKVASFNEISELYKNYGPVLQDFWKLLNYCTPSLNHLQEILHNLVEISEIKKIPAGELLEILFSDLKQKKLSPPDFLNLFKEKLFILRFPQLTDRKKKVMELIRKLELERYLLPFNWQSEADSLNFQFSLSSPEALKKTGELFLKSADSPLIFKLMDLI